MKNIVERILTEIIGATRFKWHGMAIAWVVCMLGWVGIVLTPNNYESKAVLYIDTASVLRPLLADLAVSTNVMSEVRMMSEILLSRPQLERVVRDTDLDLRADDATDMEDLLSSVRQRIQVSGGSTRNAFNEQNLYTIKFTDESQETVYAVVQSLLDSFVEKSLGQNKEDSAGAQRFIQDQIDQYEVRLAEAEQELAEFKRKNVGLMPSEGQDYYQRLQSAVDELDRLRAEQNVIATRRNELQKQIDGEEPSFGLLMAPDNRSEADFSSPGGIEQYEQEIATLLLKYTDKHPKVIDLKNRVEQMRRQNQLSGNNADEVPNELETDLASMNSLDQNPVYQSLKNAIGQANAQLSEIREKASAAESRVEYLRGMVDAVPEIEAQLARLNRDYEVNKAQHTALLRRLESARLSEQADSRSEDIKFRIIEPPVVPLQPIGPNRGLYATMVLVAGFGLGGALTFVLSLLNPVFNSVHDLRHSLRLPVLGSISVFRSKAQEKANRASLRRFGFAAVGLIIMYTLTTILWPAADLIRQALSSAGALI